MRQTETPRRSPSRVGSATHALLTSLVLAAAFGSLEPAIAAVPGRYIIFGNALSEKMGLV